MADLKQCDKCGAIISKENCRRITVFFCPENGVCDPYGYIHWKGENVEKAIVKDLCFDCWKKFVKKSHKFFDKK